MSGADFAFVAASALLIGRGLYVDVPGWTVAGVILFIAWLVTKADERHARRRQ